MGQPVDIAIPAYPWPEDEMIARYSLRHLTPEEQQVFPGLRLALAVFKARLTKPPAAVPRVRAGWIVWVAETYPGQYHLRLPGGATLLAPYDDITWERVPVETPAATIEDIRAEEKRLQAEAEKWRPGHVITTPGTRLSWDSLAGWIDAWQRLQCRAHSSDRYWKENRHMRALPREMIAAEADETILYDFLDLMNSGDARPPKGMRTGHPTTPLVVEAHNRLVQLGAVSYRQYRQQQGLRRMLASPTGASTRKRPSGEEAAPHLSLF
ncbi:MAG: hypothetical protein CL608_26325 [Anaerolineaceae bacterium]|nr:hypothetical protein [Anaerolineaceae bacterium]